MVRATYTLVLVRTAGVYPVNHTETSVGAMCTQADYILDAYTHPDTLGTGNNEKELAVSVVMNMIAEADWLATGGYGTGFARPLILTREIKDIADRLATDSSYDGFSSVEMVDES